MNIRHETPADYDDIHGLITAAFEPMAYSSGTEGPIVKALRADEDLTLSLVAVQNDNIIGHIAFSPVKIGGVDDHWYGLGPVSVTPKKQGEGIGGALIREGLTLLKALGAKGCVLIGNPAYYSRFGFKSGPHLTYGDLPTEYVQWLSFDGTTPSGPIEYSPGFNAA